VTPLDKNMRFGERVDQVRGGERPDPDGPDLD
jgi:hypothetical protein